LALPGRETQSAQSRLWFDVLRTTTAQSIATYQAEFFSGRPAITLNQFGEGKAAYVGTLGDDGLHDTVIDWALQSLDLRSPLDAPSEVEVAERWQGDQQFLFLLNHSSEAVEVPLAQSYMDLLSDAALNETLKMPPYGVSVLHRKA
jgi:beta-galactosidase